jgi:hypothetical protein
VRVSVRSARHSSPSQSVPIGVGWVTDMRGKACLFFGGHVGKEGSLDGHVDSFEMVCRAHLRVNCDR